jgi:hypothetical protein
VSNMATLTRVEFRLERDAEDPSWPPFDVETCWAEVTSEEGIVRLDNIPFYARGVSYGDLIEVKRDDLSPLLQFVRRVSRSGNRTVRVLVRGDRDPAEFHRALQDIGCETEGSNTPRLFAVSVPAAVTPSHVLAILDAWLESDVAGYEEADVDWLDDTEATKPEVPREN